MEDSVEPGAVKNGEIEGREGSFADDDGMDELDRDVLGIGGVGSAAERKKATPAKEAIGHFTADESEAMRLAVEEVFENPVAIEELVMNTGGEIGDLEHVLTDSRERISYEHIDDAAASVAGGDENGPGGLFGDFSDDDGSFAAGSAM